MIYKHIALGERVFKSEPKGDGSGPDPAILGADFATWLEKNFGWLYATGQADASVGTTYTHADESRGIPSWALQEFNLRFAGLCFGAESQVAHNANRSGQANTGLLRLGPGVEVMLLVL